MQMDTWVEVGPWLLLPILLIAAFAFRKGIVVGLVLLILPLQPQQTYAADETAKPQSSKLEQFWTDLWQTPDQQAAKAYAEQNHSEAASLFEQDDWKSAALYKSGEFNAAADILAEKNSATAHYNRANALAHSGQLEQALSAYDEALAVQDDMEDALYNKQLVEELLKQQKEQEQQQQDSEQENQEQNQEQQDSDQQSEQDQENQDQEQDQEQQEQEQQQQEQQNEQEESEQEKSELEQMDDAEREQVLEQWLRMIKDDPGGLLRRKMYMEYQRRQQQRKNLQNKGEKVW